MEKTMLRELNRKALGMTVFHKLYGKGCVVYSGGRFWEVEFENFENTGKRVKMVNAHWCFEEGFLRSEDPDFDLAIKATLKKLKRAEMDNKKALAGF